jgi:Leucine-rich repeat (LRR) protein
LREGATYHYNESEYLGKYQNPEFDIFDFILANKMCLWHRASAGRSAYFEVSHRTLQLANYPERCVSASIATLDFIRYITLPAHKNFDLVAAMEHLQHLSLESVHLENIRLDSFPTVLFGLSRLRTLTIKKGTYRPRSPMQVFADHHPLGSATLEKLSIDGYPISGEQFLGPFPALKEVEITRCSLERIDFLQDSLQLTHLILRSNHLAYLPELLGKCTKLKWLDASNNPFQKIELDLRELQELVHLEISLNR